MMYRDLTKKREQERRYYREVYSEKKKKLTKKYYLENRDKCLAQMKVNTKKYYLENIEKRSRQNKELYRRNWQKRRKQIDNYERERIKKDFDFAIRKRLRIRLRNMTKFKDREYRETKYGINYKEIIEHLKPFPKDISNYHVDHIKPLCSFDLTDPKQIKIAFAPENHQWLLAEENLKKGGKINE